MANNFAGLHSVPIEAIMDFLKRQTNTQLLQHVLNASGPESEAFAESLFRAAIELGDARVVEVLLQKGLNPNDLVCNVDGRRYTPLERSSQLQNIEITRLLLHAKADVNKIFEEDYGRSPVYYAVSRSKRSRGSVELVRMLLDTGGQVDENVFACAIEVGDGNLVDLLVEFCAKTKPFDLVRFHVPEKVTKYFDNETATRMVINISRVDSESVHCISPIFREHLGRTLDTAAQRGNLDLVQYLLRSRVSLTDRTLSLAIINKNKDETKLLIDAGANVESLVERLGFYHLETTPLAEAIRWGDVEIMNLLEEKGAWSQINEKPQNLMAFKAVLKASSEVGQLTIVQKVLDLRPPNATGEDLAEALMVAICKKQEAVVLALLDAGADVDQSLYWTSHIDHDRYDCVYIGPPLLEALRQKNRDLVRSFLDADVEIHDKDLSEAAKWGDHSILEGLIAAGADVNAGEHPALLAAVKRKDTISMQIMLSAGADVNGTEWECYGSTALTEAVSNGDIEMVEYLLSIGADPDDKQALFQALSQDVLMIEKLLTAFVRRYPHGKTGYGCTALRKAIQEADLLLIETLIQAGIDANTLVANSLVAGFEYEAHPRRLTPLGQAIEEEHATSLEILQKLLNANGNPNSVVRTYTDTSNRETALLVAIETRDIRKVQLLIDAGANVNCPAMRELKRTPLQKAAEIGSFQIAKMLIDNGGSVNAQPARKRGATALQLAAIGGYVGIAELLLNHGADVNAPSAKVHGRTALEGAAEHGRVDMLKLLFNAGARLRGSEYERAMYFAKENGHMATRRYLESLYAASEGSFLGM